MRLLNTPLLVKLILLVQLLIFSSGSSAEEPFFPKLIVSGSSELHKPADQILLTISVVTQSDTAEKALSENNIKMQAVIQNLQKTGLEKGEYQTGGFNIQPVYSIPPKNPPPEWKSVISGYTVSNTLNIRTPKLNLAPAIIDSASAGGANQISGISFGLKDHQRYRSEAIALATANAIADANILANAANLKLVRILNITLEQPMAYPRANAKMMSFAAVGGNMETPIEEADVEINSSVTVTFEIASGKDN